LARRGRRVPRDPEVSIVIPVLDRIDLLLQCLSSLSRLEGAALPETIVVANGTPRESLAHLHGREDIVLVPSPVNLGFSSGCNWGARFAHGRHLVFLNDDTEVAPDWLAALLDVVARDDHIGAVGSRLLSFDGFLQEAGGVLWSNGDTHRLGRGSPAGAHVSDGDCDVDYCSACALLVTRAAWQAAGGFDENYYPAYYEDVDFCLSLRAQGYRIVCASGARVRHHEGASTYLAHRLMVAHRSRRYFVDKWTDALNGYEPCPDAEGLDAAVAAAGMRTAGRELPPLSPGPRQTPPPRPPTEAEAVRVQFRAARSHLEVMATSLAEHTRELKAKDERLALSAAEAVELRLQLERKDEILAQLAAELARFRLDHQRVDRLRSLVRRLPFGARVASRFAKLGAARGRPLSSHPEADDAAGRIDKPAADEAGSWPREPG
jgi:GT2 family glycosyltransferase